jgi:hypothetical protein
MALVCISSFPSIPMICRFGLLIVLQTSCMFHSDFHSIYSLSLTIRSNSSTLSYVPDTLVSMLHSVFQAFNWDFHLRYWAVHFRLTIFQYSYIFIDFLFLILHGLNFIHLFGWISLSSFSCLFTSSLSLDSSFCISSVSSLISLSIIFWNSIFNIFFFSLLIRPLVVELAFQRDLLPGCFIFLHWDLHVWCYFRFKFPSPVPF